MIKHITHYSRIGLFILLFLSVTGCKKSKEEPLTLTSGQYVMVLGTAQDAGYPQANCHKSCCKDLWKNKSRRKMTSCIGLIDMDYKEYYIFDATPDFKDQIELIQQTTGWENQLPSGIFLTHAHIGHYTGLMHLGREVIGSNETPVYAMPEMKNYLETNGPWSQLVTLNNISLHGLKNDSTIVVGRSFKIKPLQVPHRDEYSETVGYSITTDKKSILFIPDIDKWQKWNRDIIEEIKNHDISYLDGSFYANGEIPNRDMSEIPHPFLTESMELFDVLGETEKSSVHFIHFNHTNPVLNEKSEAYRQVTNNGFTIAAERELIEI